MKARIEGPSIEDLALGNEKERDEVGPYTGTQQ